MKTHECTPLKRIVESITPGAWGDDPVEDGSDTVCIRVADFERSSFTANVCDEPTLRRQDRKTVLRIGLAFGDILLERSGETGYPARYIGMPGVVYSNFLLRLRATPACDARYLWYVLQWAYVSGIAASCTNRTTMSNLDMDAYMSERVPMWPIRTQEVIADYLEREITRIDALVAAKRRMMELLEERWRAFLNSVIWSDVGRTTCLMRIVDPRRQIMYGIVLPGPDIGGNGIPIVKGGDVAQRRLSWNALCKTTPEIEAPYARARLRGGDLVFAIRGGIGDVAIVPEDLAGANITQDVARVAPLPEINSEWLAYALESFTTQYDVQRRVTGATITGLNIWELDRVAVPTVSRERQERDRQQLNGEAKYLHAMRDALNSQVALLQERRQALITAAITGQLDIPEAA